MRIDIMRNLLNHAQHNAHMSGEYDAILDEFEQINRIRNDYVHGVWMVEINSGALHFWNADAEIISNLDPRIVTLGELHQLQTRVKDFTTRIMLHKPESPSSP